MNIDAGRERIDEGRQRRRAVDRLTPAAKPGQTGALLASSASRESADQNEPRERNEASGPKEKARQGARGMSLLPTWLGRLGFYGLALLLVGVAVLLHRALGDVLSPTPFLVFYLAWVAAAAFGGLGPGLLAMLASWLCVDLFFDPTPWHVSFHDPGSVGRLMVLLAGGLAVSVVGETMRRSRIRERRQGRELADANAALRASEEKYRIVADNTYDWEFWLDPEDRFLYTSPSCERVTGYAAREFMSHPGLLQEIIHPEDLAAFLEHQHEIPSSRHGDIEFRIITKHDETRWIHHLCQPIDDKDGRYAGSRGSNRDITERKLAEEVLRASEEKYRFLVENSKDITWTVDLQGQWTFISSNVEKVTGYRVDEVIGKTIWDFLAPECHDLVKDKLRRRERSEDVPPYEVLVVRKDGRHTPFELHTTPIVDDRGSIVGVQGVSRDITERKRAEEALRESEKRYRGIVEDQTELICLFEGDATITFVNDAYCRYFGKKREELVGHKFLPLIAEADREAVKAPIAALSRGDPLVTLEQRVRRPDGSIAWQEWKNRAVFDMQGHLTGYQAVGRDITERKRAEEAVAESRKKYRGLVEKINDWVWEIDADGVYTYSSPRALELLGYPPEEIVAKTPFDLMPPAEAQRVWNAFHPIWLERKPLELLENTLVRKDGRLVTVETSGMPVFAEDRTFLGYTGIDRDVTARKWAEETLRASQTMLQSVMENVPQGIFWKDRHSTYLGCNKVFVKAVGLESARDVVGKTDYDLPWLPEQTASFREYDRRIMDNDAPEYHIVERMRAADGRLTWVETNKAPLHDAQGHVIGILATYEDITERKQAEQALRESEEKFRLLAETSPAAILIYQDGKYVYANPAAESITGYRRAELLPQAPGDIVHPDYRQQVKQMVSRRAEGEESPMHYELKILTKDGQERWMDSATVSIRYGNKPAGLVVAFDITERKQAEAALRQEKIFTDRLLNAPFDTVFVFEPVTGRPVRWNKRFAEVSGYDDEEIAGMRAPDDFYDENDLKKAKECRGRILADGQGVVALSLITKQGVHIPFEYVTTVVEAEDGKTLFLSIGRDITERKRAEGALREWNATLESKVAQRTEELEHRAGQLQKLTLELTEAEERERKRLADILHDDLQQVLAATKFQVSLLSSRIKNDAESQEIAEQAKDLLVDAIAKSRSLSHELSAPTLSQSDLGETFEWLAEQMQKKHGFTVHLDICERIELASEPLRVLLYKAAQESLFNAIKHAGVREAKLRLRHQRGRIRLSVSDEGRGFDPTEPAYNLGFGLLSIRERVGCLGGRLKIRSAVGKGSVFLITVPDAEVHEGK